jgi:hypothetical protein
MLLSLAMVASGEKARRTHKMRSLIVAMPRLGITRIEKSVMRGRQNNTSHECLLTASSDRFSILAIPSLGIGIPII